MSEHTPFLQVIPQRHGGDCSVACLAMLLGVSYEKALLVIGLESVIEHGTYIKELQRAAKTLGRPLRNRKRFDIENDTGILMVKSPNWPSHHLVVLKDGLVIDTDATIWDVDVFLAGYTATVIGLLALEERL